MNHQEKKLRWEQFRAARKEAGLKIDPETAEVDWNFGYVADPYGIGTEDDIPEELRAIDRLRFARSPGSDVWVYFGDLPDATRDALWRRHKSRLAFPAGLVPFELFPEEIDELLAKGHITPEQALELKRGRERKTPTPTPPRFPADRDCLEGRNNSVAEREPK
jgi:hypothetical protein